MFILHRHHMNILRAATGTKLLNLTKIREMKIGKIGDKKVG